jgi:pyruvate kinase
MIATSARIPLGILVDLPGPKIRVGKVSPEPMIMRNGSELTLTSRLVVGNPRLVSLSHPPVLRELNKGDSVFLADGTTRLTVEYVKSGEAICHVTRGSSSRPAYC